MIEVEIPEDVLAQIAASEEEDDSPETHDTDSSAQAPPNDGPQQSPPAAEPEEGKETEPQSTTPETVPYSRLQEVVAAKNAAKAEAERLKKQLAEYEAISFDTPGDGTPPDSEDLSIEARLQRIELAEAAKRLETEVAAVLKDFPEVPEAVLYKAVAEDPTIDVAVVAKSYTEHIEGIRKKAIEDYLAKNPAPKNPPALKTSGTAGRTPRKPKTLSEAHAAMRAAVRQAEW